jgi:CheY-like chemotaxis protein
MKSVTLCHWNAAEGIERLDRLRKAGFAPRLFDNPTPGSMRALKADPPDLFLIDLSRMPSHGRAVAIALRQHKGTRNIPLVFVDGEKEKVERIRQLLPDAVFTTWAGAGRAIRSAKPGASPVVPKQEHAFTASPLPKKLNIKPHSTVFLIGAPDLFERRLDPLPEGVAVVPAAKKKAQLVLLFAASLRELEMRFPAAERALAPAGGIWIIWPKKASGARTDLDGNLVRRYGMDAGYVDYKICAVDETWSGHLFALRKK